jgi:hypothetical protein
MLRPVASQRPVPGILGPTRCSGVRARPEPSRIRAWPLVGPGRWRASPASRRSIRAASRSLAWRARLSVSRRRRCSSAGRGARACESCHSRTSATRARSPASWSRLSAITSRWSATRSRSSARRARSRGSRAAARRWQHPARPLPAHGYLQSFLSGRPLRGLTLGTCAPCARTLQRFVRLPKRLLALVPSAG